MGIFFSYDKRLKKWANALTNAAQLIAKQQPFVETNIVFTTQEFSNSIKIHGVIYYKEVWYYTKYSKSYCENEFISKMRSWINYYEGQYKDSVPNINGHFRVVRKY